jgi:hypothetical protein
VDVFSQSYLEHSAAAVQNFPAFELLLTNKGKNSLAKNLKHNRT